MIYPHIHNDTCRFRVWAPLKETMNLHLEMAPAAIGEPVDASEAPGNDLKDPVDAGAIGGRAATAPATAKAKSLVIPMIKDQHGYFYAEAAAAKAGDRYRYQPDNGSLYADPASAFQPEGVSGPSQLVDHASFHWSDSNYTPPPFETLILYEIHVGTFTREGTFDAIIPRLPEFTELGINAIELMPVAQNPGRRNWGYDGVFLYSIQEHYGGPEGLRRFVDACHQYKIAVFLDVVYNHIGGEGNILENFGPYFSESYQTPWGKALNFDGAWSDGVRSFIVDNALYWAEFYHIDGLRLDAIHEIFDRSATTIWEQLHNAVNQWSAHSGRRLYLIAESDLNNPRVIRCPEVGGMGFDAQWLDDFHHSLYTKIDPPGIRNYSDYGRIEQIAKAYSEGFVHSGDFVVFRHRCHGASSAGMAGSRFVVFNQNHDIPGNRPDGKRLSSLVGYPELRLAAAALLLSPYIPLLFMGEEYGESSPFYFFSDYSKKGIEKELIQSRKKQFEAFNFDGDPNNPQDEEVFLSSKLNWNKRKQEGHAQLLEWYKQLIHLRRTHPLLSTLSKTHFRADLLSPSALSLYRQSWDKQQRMICLFNFSSRSSSVTLPYDTTEASLFMSSSTTGLPEKITAATPLDLPGWAAAVYITDAVTVVPK